MPALDHPPAPGRVVAGPDAAPGDERTLGLDVDQVDERSERVSGVPVPLAGYAGDDRGTGGCMDDVTRSRGRPRRLREVHATRRGYVLAWWGFTVTFVVLRLITWLIRVDVSALGDVDVGGVHLHHYLWGILLLAIVGFAGLGDRRPKVRSGMGLVYGVGLALVVDEAALLIQLEDVYWDTFGWVSVALAVSLIGIAGSVLAVTRAPRQPGT